MKPLSRQSIVSVVLRIAVATVFAVPLLIGPPTARAGTDCDVPNPPPICGIGEDEPLPDQPFGAFEEVKRIPAGLHVRGWAIDPATTAAIRVQVTVNGRAAGDLIANASRPDVGSEYPFGSNHGFDGVVSPVPGSHVCVHALPNGGGSRSQLGCKSFTVTSNPIGSLDVVEQVNLTTVRMRGWAIDPDTAAAIDVHIYMDGGFVKSARANLAPGWEVMEVSAPDPYGDAHRFDTTLPAAKGTHEFCVYAINVAAGSVNSLLGCKTYAVGGPPGAPTIVSVVPRQVSVDSGYTAFVAFRDNADDETAYSVEGQDPSGLWRLIGSTGPRGGVGTIVELDAGAVAPLERYCYIAAASNVWGESKSTPVCLTIPPLPPLAPSNTAVTGKTATTVSLSWQDNSLDEESFVVYPGGTTAAGLAGTGTVRTTISGLSPATTYCFSVASRRSAAGFGTLESLRITFPCVTTDQVPPTAPGNLGMSLDAYGRLVLGWEDRSSNESGFRVERSSGGAWSTVGTLAPNATSFITAAPALLSGMHYCYRVVAFNVAGDAPSTSVCRGLLSDRLSGYETAFKYRTNLDSPAAGARVSSVKNTARSLVTPPGVPGPVDMIMLVHEASDGSTRTLASLGGNQSTTAFNGQPVAGHWKLAVTNISAVFLYWGCTRWNEPDYFLSCADRATISLEISWTSP